MPVLLTGELWGELWRSFVSQAWDGSGHYALAQIYSDSVFPDTFGWTDAYFAGMGFPNFYPPLFYWLVALIACVVPFGVAFKLVVSLPVLLLPCALWLLAWRLSGKNKVVAACAALAALPLLVDYRLTNSLGTMGLSYTSTFLLGLYTQTLGLVLLIAWYVLFTSEKFARQVWRVALASVLLALALLANFFSATIIALFVLTTLASDAARLARSGPDEKGLERRTLLAHLISPLAGGCLTLFWLVPLFNSYAYVVTRPQHAAITELVPWPLWVWYALAAAGMMLWLRRPGRAVYSFAVYPFVAACGLIVLVVLSAGVLGPRWFPLQPPRLLSTLNFLLAAPVGNALAGLLGVLGFKGGREERAGAAGKGKGARRQTHSVGLSLQRTVGTAILALAGLLFLFALISPPIFKVAFYDEAEWARVSPVLDFARQHRDGRYLVENQPFSDTEAAHDGRAINAYLGRQGNASLSLFFREGAPNVLFLNPLVDTFSAQPDSYGISSALADDADFAHQPLASHIERARFFGTRYMVIRTQSVKDRLAAEREVAARHDFGQWSVFELAGETPPTARALAYRPALLVTDFTLKLRRQDDLNFVRFAEEQFASGWFDVLLARSPESKLDRLEVPEGFGSLIVESYRYDDEEKAYARLRAISQERHLILLSDANPLFNKIRASLAEFPQAEIIECTRGDTGPWLESDRPTKSYADSPTRKVWAQLRESLDRRKLLSGAVDATGFQTKVEPRAIRIEAQASPAAPRPLLIATTFHPNWRRDDGGQVYAATPFFMLTFARGPAHLAFTRGWSDSVGLYASAATLLLLLLYTAWHYRGRLSGLSAEVQSRKE